MKYIFIAGLEHSGSTITNHLLSQGNKVLGLGEVGSFFSKKHMEHYIAKYDQYPDYNLCSCGATWKKCTFWGDIVELSGLYSDIPTHLKYKHLIRYIRSNYADINVAIDSSKSLPCLSTILLNCDEIGLRRDDLLIVFCVKDVRNFASSIVKKNESTNSLLSHLKTFNWWLGANQNFIDYFKSYRVSFETVLYENLCADPQLLLSKILRKCSISFDGSLEVSHNKSHIVMGNKNFIFRNREKISYDNRWFLEDGINLAYIIHLKARRLNKKLYYL